MPFMVPKWKIESPSTLLWSAAPVKKKEIIERAENKAIIKMISPTIKCVTSLVKNRTNLEDSPAGRFAVFFPFAISKLKMQNYTNLSNIANLLQPYRVAVMRL
jgi:hypothetical protein